MSEKTIHFRSKKNWINIIIISTIFVIFYLVYNSLPSGYEQKHFAPDTLENLIGNNVKSIYISHTSSETLFHLDSKTQKQLVIKVQKLAKTNDFKSKGAKAKCKIIINLQNGDRAVIEIARGYTINHPDIANFMIYSENKSFFYDRYDATGICKYIKYAMN